MLRSKNGKFQFGQNVRPFGFIVIAIGGEYSSITKDFRVGSPNNINWSISYWNR